MIQAYVSEDVAKALREVAKRKGDISRIVEDALRLYLQGKAPETIDQGGNPPPPSPSIDSEELEELRRQVEELRAEAEKWRSLGLQVVRDWVEYDRARKATRDFLLGRTA